MIGDKIKEARKNKNITQKDFANILNIPVSTLANYENNHREPNLEMIKKIAKALNISPDELITGKSLFDGSLGFMELSKLILNKSLESENPEIKYTLIEDVLNGILTVHQKNRPNFKTFEEYKKNISSYWEDVIVWYPINKINGFDLDTLEDNEITEVAMFLDLAFQTKILEIKNKRAKKNTFKKFFGDSKDDF
ncbi:helix-turn-helix domain-containing protein [Clostridium tertium]|uniref:helix-turn-helix domain-containing protein n=1 Tax=Clostridium tertium TaxID=1559 RepID=UPI00356B0DEE